MNRRRSTWTTLIIMFAAAAVSSSCNRAPSEPVADMEPMGRPIANHQTIQVDWGRDLPAALDRASNENKTVLVNFYADWCVWCRRLQTTTFQDATVATMLTEQLVPVSLNVEGDGLELSNEYGVESLPTVVVLDAKGVEIGRITGYFPPASFIERVEAILPQG